ncbi:hypothetical protein P168DRAFT_70794 [Aspergillus campestris IBT 28561]|uniref:Uncharacterized protein n=1 Tax=Aspergillus campestris (strain IBT 28561) TaxID=1392248 RepID=A0A2I1CSN8_ASPC2|nr:uncharacterized protein P168DRAFT_70794 [Aspergillus campestris IBT 28561]PKY00634.1 hypothetical protein P168DRAFT_70794 [Aspergillus campestris IBT 28561]
MRRHGRILGRWIGTQIDRGSVLGGRRLSRFPLAKRWCSDRVFRVGASQIPTFKACIVSHQGIRRVLQGLNRQWSRDRSRNAASFFFFLLFLFFRFLRVQRMKRSRLQNPTKETTYQQYKTKAALKLAFAEEKRRQGDTLLWRGANQGCVKTRT